MTIHTHMNVYMNVTPSSTSTPASAPTSIGFTAPQAAHISRFRSPTQHILFGQSLSDVKTMARSITQHGLLSPLLVSQYNGRLIVIDGRKRLAALRRLRFQKKLPQNLKSVPFIMSAHSQQTTKSRLNLINVFDSV